MSIAQISSPRALEGLNTDASPSRVAPVIFDESLPYRVGCVVFNVLKGLVVFWVIAQCLKPLAKYMLLPAAGGDFEGSRTALPNNLQRLRTHEPLFEKVTTHDGAVLDTLILKHRQSDANTRTVLVCQPNGASYAEYFTEDSVHPMVRVAAQGGERVNFAFFDYRGVGRSKGSYTSEQDLVTDGASVLWHLKDRLGTRPENVVFYGSSLGGGVAARVQGLDTAHTGGHINVNSMSTIADVVVPIPAVSPATDGIYEKVVRPVLNALTSYFLSLMNLELNPVASFNQIRGPKVVLYHTDDQVIRSGARMVDFGGSMGNPQTHFIRLHTPEGRRGLDAHCSDFDAFEGEAVAEGQEHQRQLGRAQEGGVRAPVATLIRRAIFPAAPAPQAAAAASAPQANPPPAAASAAQPAAASAAPQQPEGWSAWVRRQAGRVLPARFAPSP